MNGTYDTRIAVRAKVVFLGLFVLALLTARLVVALRTAVVLGAPIDLEHSGFSVSMPEGNGWNRPRGWDYSEGKATLIGTFAPGSWKATALARCSFIFPDEIMDLDTRFERRRRAVEGEIVENGRIETKSLVIDWVRIDQTKGYNYMFGTAELPDYRRIEIEVQESTGDLDLAESVFEAIASALKVTQNPVLESGAKIISEMKDRGLADTLENNNRQDLFLIRDSRRRQEIIGFTTDVLIDNGRDDELNIEAMGMYYRRGRSARGITQHEEVQSFQSDNRFDRFTWKSELAAKERTGVEIELEDTGVLRVSKFGSSFIGDSREPYRYHTSSAMVPEILLEQLLARMIEEGLQEILVDMVTSYGSIIPTHISQIRPESAAGAEDAAYLVKLMPLDGRGFLQLAYLDEQNRISRSLVRGRDTLIFERATPEEAAREFPERSEFILQNEKLRQYLDQMI